MGRSTDEIAQLYSWHVESQHYLTAQRMQLNHRTRILQCIDEWLMQQQGEFLDTDDTMFCPLGSSTLTDPKEQQAYQQQLELMQSMKVEMYRRINYISEQLARAETSPTESVSIDSIRITLVNLNSQIDTYWHTVETMSAFARNHPVIPHTLSTSLDPGSKLILLRMRQLNGFTDLRKTLSHFQPAWPVVTLAILIRVFPTLAIALVVVLLNVPDLFELLPGDSEHTTQTSKIVNNSVIVGVFVILLLAVNVTQAWSALDGRITVMYTLVGNLYDCQCKLVNIFINTRLLHLPVPAHTISRRAITEPLTPNGGVLHKSLSSKAASLALVVEDKT